MIKELIQRSVLMQCAIVNTDTLLFKAGNRQLSTCCALDRPSVIVPSTKAHDRQNECKKQKTGRSVVKCFPLDRAWLLHMIHSNSAYLLYKIKPVKRFQHGVQKSSKAHSQLRSYWLLMVIWEGRVAFLQDCKVAYAQVDVPTLNFIGGQH